MGVEHVRGQVEFRSIDINRETLREIIDEINYRRICAFVNVEYITILRMVFDEKASLIGRSELARKAYKSAVAKIQNNRRSSRKQLSVVSLPVQESEEFSDDVWATIRTELGFGEIYPTPVTHKIIRAMQKCRLPC